MPAKRLDEKKSRRFALLTVNAHRVSFPAPPENRDGAGSLS